MTHDNGQHNGSVVNRLVRVIPEGAPSALRLRPSVIGGTCVESRPAAERFSRGGVVGIDRGCPECRAAFVARQMLVLAGSVTQVRLSSKEQLA